MLLRFHDSCSTGGGDSRSLQLEAGKARKHAFEEVVDTAIVARFYAVAVRLPRAHAAPRPSRASPGSGVPHPKGVVGIISPWNYPLSMGITDAIRRCSPATPRAEARVQTSLLAALGARSAGRVRPSRGAHAGRRRRREVAGAALLEAADSIAFTGSTRGGRRSRAGGQRLIHARSSSAARTRCSCSPTPISTRRGGRGARLFSSAGQLCISIERLYVQCAPRPLPRRFRARDARLSVGADFPSTPTRLAGGAQAARHRDAHVADAVAKGAPWGRRQGPARSRAALLRADDSHRVTPDMPLSREETFGPVVSVYPFDDSAGDRARQRDRVRPERQHLVARHRARPPHGDAHPDRHRQRQRGLRRGLVGLDGPMGGFKDSGLGRRHGREGIFRFTQSQTVATQSLIPLAPRPGQSPKALPI